MPTVVEPKDRTDASAKWVEAGNTSKKKRKQLEKKKKAAAAAVATSAIAPSFTLPFPLRETWMAHGASRIEAKLMTQNTVWFETVVPSSDEWNYIVKAFAQSPCLDGRTVERLCGDIRVTRIERVVNYHWYRRWHAYRQQLNFQIELLLFYGTHLTSPYVVASDKSTHDSRVTDV